MMPAHEIRQRHCGVSFVRAPTPQDWVSSNAFIRTCSRPPIDAFQQIAELGGRQRHRAFGAGSDDLGPDETAFLQTLGEQACALTVMPKHLDEIAAPTVENEQMAAMGIALQLLLHRQRQTVEAFAHVGRPRTS